MAGGSVFWLSYAVLWALVLLLSFAMVLLLRDLGKRRLVSPEGRRLQALPVGELWSGVTVPTLKGTVRLPAPGVGQIIVVAARRCSLCRQALLMLGELAAEASSSLEYVFVYPGDEDEMRMHIGDAPAGVRIVQDRANVVRKRLGIVAYPYAVAVDADGRTRDAMIAHRRTDLEKLIGALNVGHAAVAATG